MMHDPFQNYATLGQQYGGQHYGMPSPIGLQYPQQQASGINPMSLAQSPYGQNPAQGFINPQQLQLAALVASNPVLAASLLSNPFVAASLHSQSYGNPQFGLPQPSLYPQIGQIGYPLAPQSWIGQGAQFGAGQGFGPRPFQAQGFSPWGY